MSVVCGGAGIPEGDCDCNGNQLDECGGMWRIRYSDGICEMDPCDGALDECGVQVLYRGGCADIPEGDCDCDGNQLA